MNKIGLIIWREYWTRVRKKSFLIMTVLGPVLIVGAAASTGFLAMQESGPQNVFVYDEAHLFTNKLTPSKEIGITYFYSDENMPDSVFKESPYTMLVYLNAKIITNDQAQVYYKSLPSQKMQNYISNDIEQVLRKAKLNKDSVDVNRYDEYSKPLKIDLLDVNKGGKKSYDEAKAWLGFLFGYLIFIFIFLYGVQVMRGVMEEKQNRIVEVLISSVRPFQLMMGKIVGIAMVGLTQYLVWVGLIAIPLKIILGMAREQLNVLLSGGAPQATVQIQHMIAQQHLPPDSQEKIQQLMDFLTIWDQIPVVKISLMFVFYFLGGYLLYSSLFAAVGAAVDSETDTQQFMLPVTIPMIIAISIAQTAVYNPDGPAVFWCSIIPLTSPVVMMVRIATGNAFEHPWQLFLSMAMLVGTFVFTTWLAGRIYRTGILMYGKKVSWKEMGKWLFYKG